jgi:hypothetical protein
MALDEGSISNMNSSQLLGFCEYSRVRDFLACIFLIGEFVQISFPFLSVLGEM